MESERAEAMERSEIAGIAFAPRIWRALTLGGRLNRRVAVLLWSAGGIGIGLLFSWSWLVAAGLSSVVLAILPCAAMCAAGLCMGGGKSRETDTSAKGGPGRDQA